MLIMKVMDTCLFVGNFSLTLRFVSIKYFMEKMCIEIDKKENLSKTNVNVKK